LQIRYSRVRLTFLWIAGEDTTCTAR